MEVISFRSSSALCSGGDAVAVLGVGVGLGDVHLQSLLFWIICLLGLGFANVPSYFIGILGCLQ